MRVRLGEKRFRRERTGKESRKKDENPWNAKGKLTGRKKGQENGKGIEIREGRESRFCNISCRTWARDEGKWMAYAF